MKIIKYALTGALSGMAMLGFAQTGGPAVSLTLDECLGIALSESPVVKVADMEVRRMDYSKRETLASLFPNVDFSASYSRTIAKQVMYMNMDFGALGGGAPGGDAPESRAGGSGDGGIKMGLDNSYTMGFQASMPLVSAQLWESISLSDVQIVRSVEAARQSRQTLVNQVKNAYYTLLLAQNSRQVIQESYDMAELTHRTYVNQFEAGAASDYDVLRTSVAMRNIEPQLIQADISIKQAHLQLLLLMGLDSDFAFTANDSLPRYQADMYGQALATSSDYSENADLRLLSLDADMTRRNLRIQRLAYVPTLALNANYSWASMSNGNAFKNFRWNPNSSVGLSLSVPIFSGGKRYSAVRQAAIQVQELELQRTNLERSVAMQVNLAIDNINLNVRQIASCDLSVQQAERAHNIMESSFDIGAASYLDLRDSQLALTQARLSYLQAIYNYLVAQSDLELLRGDAPIELYTSAQ